MSNTEDRMPALDGLRGSAMLLVMLFHVGLSPFGWVALQIFFVLSSFLITRLLLVDKERQSSSACLKQFYIRRAFRIFPAYYVYLLFVLAGTFLYSPIEPIRHFLPGAFIHIQNFLFISYDGPALPDICWQLISHLWSLAVEEHFYFVWPLLILVVPPRHYKLLILIIFLASNCSRVWIYFSWHSLCEGCFQDRMHAVHLFSGNHFDAFAIGALLALMEDEKSLKTPRAGFLYVLISLVIVAAILPLTPLFPGEQERFAREIWKYPVANLLAAQALILCLTHEQFSRAFSNSILRFFGKISYATYLYHMLPAYLVPFAVAWLSRYTHSIGVSLFLVLPFYVFAALLMGWLSFRYIEMPFMRMRPGRTAFSRQKQPAPAPSLPLQQ